MFPSPSPVWVISSACKCRNAECSELAINWHFFSNREASKIESEGGKCIWALAEYVSALTCLFLSFKRFHQNHHHNSKGVCKEQLQTSCLLWELGLREWCGLRNENRLAKDIEQVAESNPFKHLSAGKEAGKGLFFRNMEKIVDCLAHHFLLSEVPLDPVPVTFRLQSRVSLYKEQWQSADSNSDLSGPWTGAWPLEFSLQCWACLFTGLLHLHPAFLLHFYPHTTRSRPG